MTILEVLAKVNKLKPNGFEQTEKIDWLSTCEWNIKRDIIDTHEGYEKVAFTGFNETTPTDTVLIAPAPYDELYVRWLEAQIDYANGDIGRYNNSMALYNEAVSSYRNYYNRVHMPLQKNSMKYF
ncbi:MAG: hypothetical protein J6A49_10805 [Clostridia bacterium]|nr:hypothetical protein [Clostridia bacterium]